MIRSYPDAKHVGEVVYCRLPAGHRGMHAADVTRGHHPGKEFWLRWRGLDREWFEAEDCAVVSDYYEYEPGERDFCLLYVTHPGPHTYVYYPRGCLLYDPD